MTQQLPPDWARQIQYAAAAARQATDSTKVLQSSVEALTALLKKTTVDRSTGPMGPPNLQYIENIPGRRVPFDFVATMLIENGRTSVVTSTIQVSQEGPFVAVSRIATFQSQFQFQRIDPTTQARANFYGRSYNRFRPIHSAWDLMDGMQRSQAVQQQSFPGTGAPHILSPSNGSPFRSMQPDFMVRFLNAGSSFPRSNVDLPSTFWTEQINSPFNLGALDFFERGEQLQFNVLPLHENNPSFGNIAGFASGTGPYPFLSSGWDYVEGVSDPVNAEAGDTDPVTRLANGILTIGFHGYRIVQPAGAGAA